MTAAEQIHTGRITDEAGPSAALALLAATYEQEKGWIAEPHSQFPAAHLGRTDISWYLVFMAGEPSGCSAPSMTRPCCSTPSMT